MNPASAILGSHIDDVLTAEDATAKLNRKLADKKAAESVSHKGKSSTSLPVWQQVVTDERGIRRFHGAFTGGFSAGYGGTVGSKDGFTPTQFVSSRTKRASIVESTVEDFMDDEDKANNLLAESGALHSSQDFAGLSRAAQKRPPSLFADDDHAIMGSAAALEDVFTLPLRDSAGARLMRVLGWRHGHGIGPRSANVESICTSDLGHESDEGHDPILDSAVRAAKHVAAGAHISLSITDNIDGRLDSLGSSLAFAPKDVSVHQYRPKTDFHGIGFKPGMQPSNADGAAADSRNRKLSEQRVSFGSISGSITGAFGLGIDEEADDLDIYDSSSRSALSAALVEIGDKSARPANAVHGAGLNEEPHGTTSNRKCQDGRYPLEGFVLAVDPDAPSKEYAPPKVPAGFDLAKRFDTALQLPIWVQKQDRIAGFNAEQRAVILGEAKGELPKFSSGPPPTLSDTEKKTLAFSLSDRFARSATDSNDFSKDGVKMFPHEEDKQMRFEKYLSALKDNRTPSGEDVYGSRLKQFSLWQQRQEFDEFQRAAGACNLWHVCFCVALELTAILQQE
jgi:G patch domain-containing protein 1